MNNTTAKIILSNLRDRIELGPDKKYRLLGTITQMELEALDFVTSGGSTQEAFLENDGRSSTNTVAESADAADLNPSADLDGATKSRVELDVALDLSALSLPESDSNYRVCVDFGTAMSKATFVHDDVSEVEYIQPLTGC
jgi:molecular chaperone HscA